MDRREAQDFLNKCLWSEFMHQHGRPYLEDLDMLEEVRKAIDDTRKEMLDAGLPAGKINSPLNALFDKLCGVYSRWVLEHDKQEG